MFKTIKLEFRDNVKKEVVIDMTQDTSVVMTSLVDLFKDTLGGKFGDTQADAFITQHAKDVGKLLECKLQSAFMTFHRINFDDGTRIMPSFLVEKNK